MFDADFGKPLPWRPRPLGGLEFLPGAASPVFGFWRTTKNANLEIDSKMQAKDYNRLIPTGDCWCGCGEEAKVGAFFVAGHDKRAEAAVVKTVYGNVPALLVAHGFGPGGKSAAEELRRYQEEGGEYL